MAAASACFSGRVAICRLVKLWALAAASFCVKWTT